MDKAYKNDTCAICYRYNNDRVVCIDCLIKVYLEHLIDVLEKVGAEEDKIEKVESLLNKLSQL